MSEAKCPICLLESVPSKDDFSKKLYSCPRCGPFILSFEAEVNLGSSIEKGDLQFTRLSPWVRDHLEHGAPPPEIMSDTLEEVIENLPSYSPLQKQLLLLRAIERRSEYLGFEVTINLEKDYPLAWAESNKELYFILGALEERNFIKWEKLLGEGQWITIKTTGWEYLESQSKSAFTDQAFVAMSFSHEIDYAWDQGFKPAIEQAGYKPHRVDKEPHLERIDAKIIADIRDSRFLVADVTGQRQGVYFEAGFAYGFGLPIIWCVREDDKENIHFDTRQYNHIIWNDPEDLRDELFNRIRALIGKRQTQSDE